MFIPIGTNSPVKRTPFVNIGLIVANVILYLFFEANAPDHPLISGNAIHQFERMLVLDAASPRLYQFITYQFLHSHESMMHIIGNMIFLAVFGNSVNAKMGHLPYLLFYLAGGVFAGTGYAFIGSLDEVGGGYLVGASGSIAAVTTAYLALFPRSHITFIYIFFFIGKIELPSMLMILFKIVLWDNIISPNWGGAGNVAYSAHLFGYTFGFGVALIMLFVHAIPRDHFDILSLWKRWSQRRVFAEVMNSPNARAKAQYGRVARPIDADSTTPADDPRLDRITEIRMKIGELLSQEDRTAAADYYEQLVDVDPAQVLSKKHQLEIANHLYHLGRFPQAAAAYEKYLKHYASGAEVDNVRLLLGIIYARDLLQYETAQQYLSQSEGKLTDNKRREQCKHWLEIVTAALSRAKPESA